MPVDFDPQFIGEIAADSFAPPGIEEMGKVLGFSYIDNDLVKMG
jgi:hypothetical protein